MFGIFETYSYICTKKTKQSNNNLKPKPRKGTKIMNRTSNTPAELRELGPLASLFAWIDRHPRTAAALLWLQVAALLWVIFSYNFTIPAYQ